jgi:hypothetical protein
MEPAPTRRASLALLATAGIGILSPARAQDAPLRIATAGKGSAFLPYGEGLARHLARAGHRLEVRESAGSNENLGLVEASPEMLGTVFLGSAHDAWNGTGWAAGKRHANLRALFPMYETSFQIAARPGSGINALSALDGKAVGVGPARGPAEVYFRAAAEAAGIRPVIANGSPAELVERLSAGAIEALWQGAVVPVPALVAAQEKAGATVIGLDPPVIAAMLRRFPALAPATVPPGTYAGQAAALSSVAAWNFVLAHADLPEATAYALTRDALGAGGALGDIHPFAGRTRAADARSNRVVPFHPGALRRYAELGVSLPPP